MKQPKLTVAILANLRAGVCSVHVMQLKIREYEQTIAGCDLWLNALAMAPLHEMCRKDKARAQANADATRAAIDAYLKELA